MRRTSIITASLIALPFFQACIAQPDGDEQIDIWNEGLSVAPEGKLGCSNTCGDGTGDDAGGAEANIGDAAIATPDAGDHAKNTGNSCVPVSDANAKKDAGYTFKTAKNAAAAADEIEKCLKKHKCFDKDGFGPNPGSGLTIEQCVAFLCECNDEAVKESLDCTNTTEDIGGAGGKTPDACKGAGVSLGFFTRGGRNTHTVQITDVKKNADGTYTLTVRDPDDPDSTEPVIVDKDGNVDESLACRVQTGDKLDFCYKTEKQ